MKRLKKLKMEKAVLIKETYNALANQALEFFDIGILQKVKEVLNMSAIKITTHYGTSPKT